MFDADNTKGHSFPSCLRETTSHDETDGLPRQLPFNLDAKVFFQETHWLFACLHFNQKLLLLVAQIYLFVRNFGKFNIEL